MTTRTPWRSALALLLGAMLCNAAGAQTVDTRCVADGGIALCTEPTSVADPPGAPVDSEMWTYRVCDYADSYVYRQVAWASVRNGKPLFDADIVPVSTAFEQIVHNACRINVADSGWGQTIAPNIIAGPERR